MEFLEKWWGAIATVMAAGMAYVIGQNKNAWQVTQLTKDVEDIKRRVRVLETQGTAEAVTLGKIETLLDSLHRAINGLREEIKGKADK